MWKIEIVRILRNLIGDLTATLYTDERLAELIVVAAMFVNKEISLTIEYTINVTTLKICPDPCSDSIRDESFINLIALKAACILDQCYARQASRQGVAVRDSIGISIDNRGSLSAALALLKDLGYCKAYEDTKLEYELDRQAIAGRAILSPFKTDSMADSETDFR